MDFLGVVYEATMYADVHCFGDEYCVLLDDAWNQTYYGYTTTIGAGIGYPIEVHTMVRKTSVIGFNIYDALNSLFSWEAN